MNWIDANQLLHYTSPKEPYLIGPGLLRRGGRLVIYGDTGVGKSFLAFQFGMMITEGNSDIFNTFSTYNSSRVCYLDLEVGVEEWHDRLQSLAQRYSDSAAEEFWYDYRSTLKLDLRQGQQWIRQQVMDMRPSLLIIDPWLEVLTRPEYPNIMEVRSFINRLREEFGLAIMIVDHAKKPTPGLSHSINSIRFGGLVDWAESVMYLRRKDDLHLLSVEKRRSGPPMNYPIKLKFNPDSLTFDRVMDGDPIELEPKSVGRPLKVEAHIVKDILESSASFEVKFRKLQGLGYGKSRIYGLLSVTENGTDSDQ